VSNYAGKVVAEEMLRRTREVRVRLRGVKEVQVSLDWTGVKFWVSTWRASGAGRTASLELRHDRDQVRRETCWLW